MAAVAGQDFIFAIFQRSNDEVVQHAACKLDSGFQFLDLLLVAVDLFALVLNLSTAGFEIGDDIFEALGILGQMLTGFFDDIVRKAELFGNRKGITLARDTDEQPVSRTERLDTEFAAAVFDAGCGEAKTFSSL